VDEMSAYCDRLKKAQEPATQAPKQNLQRRFVAWYNGLPEVSRERLFSMTEITSTLKTQGRFISPILLELGWRRKRRWSKTNQYFRYWVPPTLES
jgi:hypothetical protein